MQDDLMFFEFAYNEKRYHDALNLAQKLADSKGSFIWHLKSCQLFFELGFIEKAGRMSKTIRLEFPYDIARNDLLQLDLIRIYYFWTLGDFDSIEKRINPVHQYAHAIDDRNTQNQWIKSVYHNIKGNLLAEQERFDDAIKSFHTSIKYKKKLKNPGFLAVTLNDLGIIYTKQGKLDQAIITLNEARELLKNINGFAPLKKRILGNLGIAHRFFNNLIEAELFLTQAREDDDDVQAKDYFTFSFHLLKVYQDTQNFDKALMIYNQMHNARNKLRESEAISLYLDSVYYQLYQN